jgi:membrane associated rhomboid family serine protease
MIKIKKGLSGTLILIIINVIIFFVAYPLSFVYENILQHVAIQPATILQGQYLWTIITSMFMHASIFHIFVNMLSLMFIGSFAERLIGKKRFIIFYLISGIIAGLFFVFLALIPRDFNSIITAFLQQDLNSMAVGASGAIFAIAGLLAVLTPKIKVYIMFIPIPMPLWLGITIMLAGLWTISIIAGIPIGNTAHLGGLLVGLGYGFYLRKKHARKVKMLDRYFR